jgi:nucleoside phosphorylase
LADRERKLLGLEMEASAIGAIAHLHGVPKTLVMKGVMDFADLEKDDHFKLFAARASAECLLAFLREHLM